MRKAIIALSFIIACIVSCYALLNTGIFDSFENKNYSLLAGIGTFVSTLVAGLYAIYEYDNHKKEVQTNLLCQYNQRYSSDKNIRRVLKWMLKVAEIENGEIIGVKEIENNDSWTYEKEMFMRFFEELNKRIDNNDINERDVYDLFSYYALKFDEFYGFRADITDYKNEKEILEMSEEDRVIYQDPWSNFRSFIDKMKKEESNHKNKQLK